MIVVTTEKFDKFRKKLMSLGLRFPNDDYLHISYRHEEEDKEGVFHTGIEQISISKDIPKEISSEIANSSKIKELFELGFLKEDTSGDG